MKKLAALQLLQKTNGKIFNTTDLKKLFGTSNLNNINKQVKGLIEAQVLERIVKGWYLLASNPPSDFELANALCRPSYISLESALNFYGILIQTPQQITCVTPKLTATVEYGHRLFSYAHLDQRYFTDYERVDNFLIATPEKALVDTMFFVALGRASLSIEELNLQDIDRKKVKALAKKIRNKAFKKYFSTITL